MAVKKPIICSDLSVLRDVLKHQFNSLPCPPDDIHCWVNALKRISQDDGYAEKISLEAYCCFSHMCTWYARSKSILDIYLQ